MRGAHFLFELADCDRDFTIEFDDFDNLYYL